MTNSLVGILLCFRQGTIGIVADIEGMFHQIRVRKEDQDSLRFLWWTNSYDEPSDFYVMQVHIFWSGFLPPYFKFHSAASCLRHRRGLQPQCHHSCKEEFLC